MKPASDVSARSLIVVAHPDDEVLGAGGLAAWSNGRQLPVRACILSGGASARHHRPSNLELMHDTHKAASILGMEDPILGDFPNIQMNIVPHLDLVQFVEAAIRNFRATHVWTHHPADLNDDHRQVSAACQAACRQHLRQPEAPTIHSLSYMEVLSSTDWAFPSSNPFQPNAFLALDESHIEHKIRALAAYRSVMRPRPHPRNPETLSALALVRGSQAGHPYAEAYELVYLNLENALRNE